eukprot:1026927-Rhodomonas_salina.1
MGSHATHMLSAYRTSATSIGYVGTGHRVHPEIKHKKTYSWYNMYGDCVFLSLISQRKTAYLADRRPLGVHDALLVPAAPIPRFSTRHTVQATLPPYTCSVPQMPNQQSPSPVRHSS